MQVDFYLFEKAQSFADCQTFACRLIEKAYQQGNQITIENESAQAAQQLNDQLWTFSLTSFIPHQQEQKEYVSVTCKQKTATHILLKLTLSTNSSNNWQRVLQIVPNNQQLKQQARELYRHYQQQMGITLNTHTIKH